MSKCIGGIAYEAVSSLATHKLSKSFGELFGRMVSLLLTKSHGKLWNLMKL